MLHQGDGNLFRTADRFQPGIILLTGPQQQNNESLVHANLLQLVSHYGIDSVKDLGLLCLNKVLRPAGIIVVNGTRIVFLMSVVTVILDKFDFGSAQPGNNFFTGRPQPGVCRPLRYITLNIAISPNEKRFHKLQEHCFVFGFLYDTQHVFSPANQPKFFLHHCKTLP